ncbi:VOC family protein [Solimonas soli]|uniref:VOC family protein n=1 Tax=Solimonas soli TaxID=413479 RepID=UPI00048485FC|nr:VOC family protein [Solimonas soli]
MIGYTLFGTNDLARATRFYDGILGELGARRGMQTERFITWNIAPDKPGFGVCKPYDGKTASVGNGTMIGLAVDRPETVDRLYRKVLELGGSDEGAPGDRGGGFYAAYFRDPDGNKLNFFCIKR